MIFASSSASILSYPNSKNSFSNTKLTLGGTKNKDFWWIISVCTDSITNLPPSSFLEKSCFSFLEKKHLISWKTPSFLAFWQSSYFNRNLQQFSINLMMSKHNSKSDILFGHCQLAAMRKKTSAFTWWFFFRI